MSVACDSRGQRARRQARKGGEGSELSLSAPEADTFAGARHDHPLGVLRIFQWKFRAKGTRRLEPRLDHIEIKPYATPGIIDFGNGGGAHPLAQLLGEGLLSPVSCYMEFVDRRREWSEERDCARVEELRIDCRRWVIATIDCGWL